MDEMTAFDRQIAREVVREAGPSEPVDGAAIFTAITTTQSHKWRFQSMFSATKFVVAGAIVALFGGFLLAGLLVQPSENAVPATSSPMPSDVDFQLEAVRPGILRVAGDGSGQTFDDVRRVAVAPDGTIWVATEAGTVYGIGVEGSVRPSDDRLDPGDDLIVLGDGTPLFIDGHTFATWDGQRWSDIVVADTSAFSDLGEDLWGNDLWLSSFAAAPDGSVWATVGWGYESWVARFDPDGAAAKVMDASELNGHLQSLAQTPDGTMWVGVSGGEGGLPTVGLLRFDSDGWQPVDLDDGRPFGIRHLEVDRHGILHAYMGSPESPLRIGRWDGDSWDIAPDPVMGFDAFIDEQPALLERFGLSRVEFPWWEHHPIDDEGRRWFAEGGLGVLDEDGFTDLEFPSPFASTTSRDVAPYVDGYVLTAVAPGEFEFDEPRHEGAPPGLYLIDPELAKTSVPEFRTVGRDGVVLLMHPEFAEDRLAEDTSETARFAVEQGTGVVAHVLGFGDRWSASLDSVGATTDRWISNNASGVGDDPISAIEDALNNEPAIDFARVAAESAVLEWPAPTAMPETGSQE